MHFLVQSQGAPTGLRSAAAGTVFDDRGEVADIIHEVRAVSLGRLKKDHTPRQTHNDHDAEKDDRLDTSPKMIFGNF